MTKNEKRKIICLIFKKIIANNNKRDVPLINQNSTLTSRILNKIKDFFNKKFYNCIQKTF